MTSPEIVCVGGYQVVGYGLHLFLSLLQTMVKMSPLGVAARSAAFSPDGELLAVGLKNGAFVVLKTADLKTVAQKRDRHQAIQDVR